jgi:predicted ATPase/class 3 adenylate cyclase
VSVPPDASAIVAFLFTDIVESTRRWETDPEGMGAALRRHDAIVRATVAPHRGHVFKTIGDAFCIAFLDAADAAHAALDVQAALTGEDFSAIGGLAVRMAIHAGVVERRDDDYFGQPLNRVARLLGIGHGEQILITPAAVALARDRLRPDVRLDDLGAHRLRDIATPERVSQLSVPPMRARHPELRSLGRGVTNLPLQITSFVGRDADVAAVVARVEASRSVTLVGPGGVGKTRLSIAVGQKLLERYPDGVWFVDLAPLSDSKFVAAAVAATLDVRVASSSTATDEIVNALAGKRVVLILDNCEHVIETGVELARELMRRCEGLRIIATSREPLSVSGEFVYRLETLAVPGPKVASATEAMTFGAVELFVDRARAIDARFALSDANVGSIVEIVRRLDGIALAIELAAPRIATLSPAQLAARLDERFRLLTSGVRGALPRQQTLHALIAWSFELLSQRERTIFRRIAIFAGGFTLDAATVVGSDDAYDAWELLDALSALQAKSLVVADRTGENARYRLLESTRAFALEKLAESDEREAIARKHATYVAASLVELSVLWEAMDERAWQDAVAIELDNVRAALAWAIGESRDAELGMRVLVALHQPLRVMVQDEAMRWYAPARELARAHPDRALAAMILLRHASLYANGATPMAARIALASKALAAGEESGEQFVIARTRQHLAILLRDAGRLEEARAMLDRAWEIASDCGNRAHLASLAGDRAVIEFEYGANARARELIDECVRLAPAGSVVWASALALRADIDFIEGGVAAARSAARIARVAFAEQRVPFRQAVVRCNEAAYALAVDEIVEARVSLEHALDALERYGNATWLTIALEHTALYAALRGDVEDAAFLMSFTDARFAALGKNREPVEASGYRRARALVSAAYPEAVFQSMRARGATTTDDQAVRLARSILERGERAGAIASVRLADSVHEVSDHD